MIRVIVVEDEECTARAIASALSMEADIEVVGSANNGADAIELVNKHLPDVVLLDLSMPVMGGLDALKAIKAQVPSSEVIIFTHCSDDFNLFRALRMGAKGYLLKSCRFEDIFAAVREVANGFAAIPPALAARVLEEFQRVDSHTPAIRTLISRLTKHEVEVLRLIGLDKSNRQIAEELCVELTTVKKHITNIRHKLEVNSRTEAALIAQSSGLSRALEGVS